MVFLAMTEHLCGIAPALHPANFRVLVVDDEPMLRSVILDFLSMLGFDQQFMAGDGREALQIIRNEPIDCMLSDIRMPNMALEELLDLVSIEKPDLSVIAISGYADFDTASNIFRKGAHDFLGKPLNLDALESALSWVIHRRHVLGHANRLFGRDALPIEASLLGQYRRELLEVMQTTIREFQPLMDHTERLSAMVESLRPARLKGVDADLVVATLLHETGASFQMNQLCREARKLDMHERRLIRSHAETAGSMIAKTLNRPEFQVIVGQHPYWETLHASITSDDSASTRTCIWLGMLNTIDGMMQHRADRSGLSLEAIRDHLESHYHVSPGSPLADLLEQWSVLEVHCDSLK